MKLILITYFNQIHSNITMSMYNQYKKLLMEYFICFHTKSMKFGVYFAFITQLISGYHTGQYTLRMSEMADFCVYIYAFLYIPVL